MKNLKFVMTETIDRMYEDLGWVDYYTIDKITNDALYMTIFTKVEITKEDERFDTLVLRNISLGEELNRDIIWDYFPSQNNIIFKFKTTLSKILSKTQHL